MYLKVVRAIQTPVEEVLSRALTLAIRLYGLDAYVRFKFNQIDKDKFYILLYSTTGKNIEPKLFNCAKEVAKLSETNVLPSFLIVEVIKMVCPSSFGLGNK